MVNPNKSHSNITSDWHFKLVSSHLLFLLIFHKYSNIILLTSLNKAYLSMASKNETKIRFIHLLSCKFNFVLYKFIVVCLKFIKIEYNNYGVINRTNL